MRSIVVGMMSDTGIKPESAAIWLDPSDLDSMRQEITGASATTPVIVGSAVGSIRNKGTVGGWVTAVNNDNRPALLSSSGRNYLQGVDIANTKYLTLSAGQVSALDGEELLTSFGCSFSAAGSLLGGTGGTAGSNLRLTVNSSGRIGFGTFGDVLTTTSDERGSPLVISSRLATAERYIRRNGAEVAADVPVNLYTSGDLTIFEGPQSNDGEMALYGMIIRIGATIADAVRNADEQYLAGKTGLSFVST